ncbi:MAG: NPCBM/NEW2 domain-containing protein [Bacteroidota bacterium]|nr:NPCBM/NEW2 domain-containing protein [Bacteroidota bacterium]MDP4213598.1 NPCBM/NEW2 domain-containing protein [Bacteroidota bacterium]MDP4249672.1 NPCBM/NEW2 domain-containing protein [Bacteroidota bacterium]
MARFFYTLVVITWAGSFCHAQDPALARTPPMGWNSWNAFEVKINDSVIRQIADAMVNSGMKAAGYEYLVLDDAWMAAERDADGNLTADPKKFPEGMKVIGDYIHSKGLKFGIYECRGYLTCQKLPGSFHHEQTDMNSFASWGVDYIKLDACYAEKNGRLSTEDFTIYRDCIKNTGRPMVLSISDFGNGAWAWGGKNYAQLWRTSGDIYPTMESVYYNASTSGEAGSIHPGFNGLWQFAGPGHWNDPDLLEVGNLANQNEDKTHFSLWSILSAPLMASTDLRSMTESTRRVLTAPEIIAVNQDPRGLQGYRIAKHGSTEVFAKPLADGTVAVLLLNKGKAATAVTVSWSQIGLKGNQKIRDLWKRQDMGIFKNYFTSDKIAENSVLFIKVGSPGPMPVAGPAAIPPEKYSITKNGITCLTDLFYIMKSGEPPAYDKSYSGRPISIRGVRYKRGIGCKSESRIMYKLDGNADRFQAVVGLDDHYTGKESGRFRVLNEDFFGNRILFDSGKMDKGTAALNIDLDVKGVQFLLLEFSGKESQGNWGDVNIMASPKL